MKEFCILVASYSSYGYACLSLFQFEYRVLLPGQPVRWVVTKSMPEKKADGTTLFHGFNADATDRKRMEELLVKERELFNTTLMSVDEGIVMATIAGEILVFNAGAEQITGYSREEALHRNVNDVFHLTQVQTGESVHESIADTLQLEKRFDTVTDFVLTTKDGTEKRIAISIAPIKGAQGEEDRSIASFRDISREYELEKQIQGFLDVNLDMLCVADLDANFHRELRQLSYHDQLTGLYNRQFLNTIIDDEMTRSENYEQKMTLCIMDMDHFKHVNDTWGHPIGDELLKLTAQTALEHKRNSDLLIRFGGEEFVMLMPGTNLGGAIQSLEKIREAIASMKHPITGKQTVSIGIAERMNQESFFDWYKRADEALYRAKRGGRNRIEVSFS